ncbi:MAG: 16S rRNA (uracil(1498)-N(3))-methyltransferase [Alcanivoracaceae bacterium]
MRRFYDRQNFHADTVVGLSDEASHHIARVLRMQPGDHLVLFSGEGGEWRAQIESVGKRDVQVRPLEYRADDRAANIPVILGLPLIKGDRMDYALQKATELGADQFHLLTTERTEVRLDGGRQDKRLSHWQQVVISACEQCGLNRVPLVHAPVPMLDFVAATDTNLKLLAHPGEQRLDPAALCQASSITLLTGPEGGFSPREREAATAAGFQPFALGQRILRAETAPVALLAAIWMARGE